MENNIAQIRKELKITQQALADKVGVTRQTILSLEFGRYNPSLQLAHAIAKTLNKSIEEVFKLK